jgi:hypothetical protein
MAGVLQHSTPGAGKHCASKVELCSLAAVGCPARGADLGTILESVGCCNVKVDGIQSVRGLAMMGNHKLM